MPEGVIAFQAIFSPQSPIGDSPQSTRRVVVRGGHDKEAFLTLRDAPHVRHRSIEFICSKSNLYAIRSAAEKQSTTASWIRI